MADRDLPELAFNGTTQETRCFTGRSKLSYALPPTVIAFSTRVGLIFAPHEPLAAVRVRLTPISTCLYSNRSIGENNRYFQHRLSRSVGASLLFVACATVSVIAVLLYHFTAQKYIFRTVSDAGIGSKSYCIFASVVTIIDPKTDDRFADMADIRYRGNRVF